MTDPICIFESWNHCECKRNVAYKEVCPWILKDNQKDCTTYIPSSEPIIEWV